MKSLNKTPLGKTEEQLRHEAKALEKQIESVFQMLKRTSPTKPFLK